MQTETPTKETAGMMRLYDTLTRAGFIQALDTRRRVTVYIPIHEIQYVRHVKDATVEIKTATGIYKSFIAEIQASFNP